jgi:hypothetical protein
MVLIEKVETGVRLWYADGEEHSATLFMWEDGNYSCDCNRSLFFGRVNGEAESDIIEADCGDDREYKVICILREDGVQLGAPTDYRSILKAAGYFGYDPSNHVGRRL